MIEKTPQLKNHHSLMNLGDELRVSCIKTSGLSIHGAYFSFLSIFSSNSSSVGAATGRLLTKAKDFFLPGPQ